MPTGDAGHFFHSWFIGDWPEWSSRSPQRRRSSDEPIDASLVWRGKLEAGGKELCIAALLDPVTEQKIPLANFSFRITL